MATQAKVGTFARLLSHVGLFDQQLLQELLHTFISHIKGCLTLEEAEKLRQPCLLAHASVAHGPILRASPHYCGPPCCTAAPPGCSRPRPAPSGQQHEEASSHPRPWPTRPNRTDTESWRVRGHRVNRAQSGWLGHWAWPRPESLEVALGGSDVQRRGPGPGLVDIRRWAVLQPAPSVSRHLLLFQTFGSLQVHAWIHRQKEEGEVLASALRSSEQRPNLFTPTSHVRAGKRRK